MDTKEGRDHPDCLACSYERAVGFLDKGAILVYEEAQERRRAGEGLIRKFGKSTLNALRRIGLPL